MRDRNATTRSTQPECQRRPDDRREIGYWSKANNHRPRFLRSLVPHSRKTVGTVFNGSRPARGRGKFVPAQKRPLAVTNTWHVQKLVDINFEHLYGLVTLFGHPTGP